MNPFTVAWDDLATEQLAEIWVAGVDRAEITSAVTLLDSLLSNDPLGESTTAVAEGLRAAIVLPLRVTYAVDQAKRVVEVASVRFVL